MNMSVTQFKAKCLGVIDQVEKEKSRVTITRHGRPVSELVPVLSISTRALFGRSKDTTEIHGDLLQTDERWESDAPSKMSGGTSMLTQVD